MVSDLITRIAPLREQVSGHPVYSRVRTVEDLRTFTEHHVFAVWDFMSLLKSLQRELTCTTVPWVPSGSAAARLVNSIVLDEETDRGLDGKPASHFELYLRAMREMGANTRPIVGVIAGVRAGRNLRNAMSPEIPEASRTFVETTFRIIETGKPHAVAAAFTFGREDVIPDMFRRFVLELHQATPGLHTFQFYLDRHIELDGDDHGPAAIAMLQELCGTDPVRWKEAESAAVEALQARLRLWDGVMAAIEKSRNSFEELKNVAAGR